MSVILQPQSSFPIVRQIANHLDTDTLYVRAVVRNADGDTIDTVDLEDKGGQRFQRRYRVPVDSSGQGAYISIITSVYTDSGYTTKSPNYGDEENTYLVFDRVMPTMRGGNGGSTVDLKAIRRIISEELDKVKPEPQETEVKEEEDVLTPKIDALTLTSANVVDLVKNLKEILDSLPKENVNLEPVIAGLSEVKQAIVDKDVTPETDLTPVYEEIDILNKEITDELLAHRLYLQETKADLVDTITSTVKEAVDTTEFVTDFQVKPRKTTKQPTTPEVPPIDLRKLV